MSFQVQNLTKQVAQEPIQYMRSLSFDQDVTSDNYTGQISSYFFPSLVFPNYVELLSATLMFKNSKDTSTDIKIKICTSKNGNDHTEVLHKAQYDFIHKKGSLMTTHKFKPSIVLDPHQTLYFCAENASLPDSCLVIAYRNYSSNFGKRLYTSFKKN
jgi:hypothetical protein